MPDLKALIFDVDGTLAETERDGHRVAFNRAFTAAGLDWHWAVEEYGNLLEVAGGKERIRFYLDQYPEKKPGLPTSESELADFIAELHRAKTTHYSQLLAEGQIPLRPGVERLLAEARSHPLRLAIATTGALPNVKSLLTHTLGGESLDWFEVIAAGDIVPQKKPAPDIYHYVLQQMNLTADDCLVIEDSRQGLQAALAAGLTTVVTVNPYTENHDLLETALVVDSLGEPDDPCGAIAGDLAPPNCIDLAFLQQLHASRFNSR